MELNGIANIKIVVQTAQASGQIDDITAAKIIDQLDVMERYMLTIGESLRKGNLLHDYPHWHEVRDNRKAYKNVKERIS